MDWVPTAKDVTVDTGDAPEECHINSLATGRSGSRCKSIIFKFIIQNSSLGTNCKIGLKWMPQNTWDGKSTLVQVIAWWQQAITWANIAPDLCHYMASPHHKS